MNLIYRYLSNGENFGGCGLINSFDPQLGQVSFIVYLLHFEHLRIVIEVTWIIYFENKHCTIW